MEAFFLNAGIGQRFCLLHMPPVGCALQGGVVYIHPFAEELNRSRRMAAQQARAFAQAGYAVLQLDMYGCGDSSGEFGDASWALWVADAALARQYLADRLSCSPQDLWLWGLRSGCLLAAELAGRHGEAPAKFLFWQPVVSGQQHLTQFLRLKLATDLVQGKSSCGVADLAQQLVAGQAVEVGGYTVSPALAQGLALASLDRLSSQARVACFEVTGAGNQTLSPVLSGQLARWRAAGYHATAQVVEGPLFWHSLDSAESMALMVASLSALQEGVA